MSNLPNSFEDAERFQRMFVNPLVEAVKVEMKQHADAITSTVAQGMQKIDGHEKRLNDLEKNQKKALLGWGVITLAAGTALTASWNYLKGKFHFN